MRTDIDRCAAAKLRIRWSCVKAEVRYLRFYCKSSWVFTNSYSILSFVFFSVLVLFQCVSFQNFLCQALDEAVVRSLSNFSSGEPKQANRCHQTWMRWQVAKSFFSSKTRKISPYFTFDSASGILLHGWKFRGGVSTCWKFFEASWLSLTITERYQSSFNYINNLSVY